MIMGILFGWRDQLPMPRLMRDLLDSIPRDFIDDGCSNVRDSLVGYDFRAACRIHDWAYCTRCWSAGSMTQAHREWADQNLKLFIKAMLPWRMRWVGWWYRAGVHLGGGISAFDSCGPTRGSRCRHGMSMPDWMKYKRQATMSEGEVTG